MENDYVRRRHCRRGRWLAFFGYMAPKSSDSHARTAQTAFSGVRISEIPATDKETPDIGVTAVAVRDRIGGPGLTCANLCWRSLQRRAPIAKLSEAC